MTSAASRGHNEYGLIETGVTPAVIVASSEFTLKSAPVRRRLQSQLTEHLRLLLRRHGVPQARIRIQGARIVVEIGEDLDEAAAICSQVFGVAWAASALVVPSRIDLIELACIQVAQARLSNGDSFAVRAKRSPDYVLSRLELEARLGQKILENFQSLHVRVRLTSPNVTLYVDTNPKETFVYSTKLRGPAGLPIGSQGKMLGAITSLTTNNLVAFHMMMRRGASIVPVSFVGLQETISHLIPLRLLLPKEKFRFWHVEGVSGFLNEAKELVRTATNLDVLAERLRFRILNELVRRERAVGIVHTQRLPSSAESYGMLATAGLALVPIHRPLVGLDAAEIEEYGESYGLRGTSFEPMPRVANSPEEIVELDAITGAEASLNAESRARDIASAAQRVLVPLET